MEESRPAAAGRAGKGALFAGAGILIVAAIIGWKYWSGGEAAAVRARLQALETEINRTAGEGLGAIAHAAEIGGYFTNDVVIDLGPGTSPIEGRAMLTGMAARLQSRLAAFRLVFDDVQVELSEADTVANVTLTASFIRRAAATGQDAMDAREFVLVMRKDGGTWRIARLTVVSTLR
jgi:hypothetical protein